MLPGMRTSRVEGSEQLRSCVSSDINALQSLHERVGWTPSATQIRPDPATRAQKEMLIANLGRMWSTQTDWVHHTFFGARATRGADGKRVAERAAAGTAVLAEQPFPYALPEGTRHMVLWCAGSPDAWSEASITSAIARNVDAAEGGEFIWYENPKKSIPGDGSVHHVQVFWRPPGWKAEAAGARAKAAEAAERRARQAAATSDAQRRADEAAVASGSVDAASSALAAATVSAPQEVSLIDRQNGAADATAPLVPSPTSNGAGGPHSHRWVATPPPPAPPPLQSVASILAAHGAPSGGGGGGGESLRTLLDGLGVGEKALNALDRPDISAASLAARSAADVADDLGLRIEDARVIVAAAASLAGR